MTGALLSGATLNVRESLWLEKALLPPPAPGLTLLPALPVV